MNYMDKKNIIIGILVIILGTSLYFNFQESGTSDNSGKISSPTQQIGNEDLFQKKQECQKYTSQIEKKLEESAFSNPQTGAQTFSALEKIFYSPKVNSCLYVAEEWFLVKGKKESETWTLVDVLSGETLLSGFGEWNKPEYHAQRQQFEDYLKDYE